MDTKKHIISNFLKFIQEKYNQETPVDEVEDIDIKKNGKSKTKPQKKDNEEVENVPDKDELKKDLLSLVQEYKMLFER
jgi:hypothetical protein